MTRRAASVPATEPNHARRAVCILQASLGVLVCLAACITGAPIGTATDGGGHGAVQTVSIPGLADSSPIVERSLRASVASTGGPNCSVVTNSHRHRASSPRIVELYPNPPTDGNVGEYVVIHRPNGSTPLTLSDGYTTARVPTDRPAGRVAVSLDPNVTRKLTDYPVVELQDHLRLAADGETLTLSGPNGTVDRVIYDDAPEGAIWYRTGTPDGATTSTSSQAIRRGEWWSQGRTCYPVSAFDVDDATTFVLPDSPTAVTGTLAGANERIRLAGYTFTDSDVQQALHDAIDRGVDVEILVETSPVGGLPEATRPLLTELEQAGATVRTIGEDGDRYGFHHPKYAVVDDTVLVTTENWKPAGVGGESSRGWGVVVSDPELADALGDVFDADASGRDTATWAERLPSLEFVDDGAPEYAETDTSQSFPERHKPAVADVDEVELLLAPDNAGTRLRELIDGADESIQIVQVDVGEPDFVLLEAALAAAHDGVDVDLLLDGSWYVAEENRALADRLDAAAANEDIPLDVRLADGGDRFEKIHAKGVIIDGETTVLGSVNWNDNSLTENREVALVLHGTEPAAYYASVFERDWSDGSAWSLPVSLALAVLAGLAGALLLGRRYIRFDDGPAATGPARETPPQAATPVTIERRDRTDNDREGDTPPDDRPPPAP
ncbi:phosphatidylserine/phosphatidylglycerophosphate/cardiolipin synthase [Halovivax ruber XH-70]|uniref:Phosphatidylserine/phosphatidylglycerophosphate/ cardiolipin synthase n=1 Tax=Halovivax ruber (strain DSM 18193 / JCM 13892 / XH-70) TaxID=797302 RepID=L0IBW9_HALRX|nr:phospholipase D-like domain-containing protein [Halovivax ruber]AGB15447.1 phosphatidylserine/phosphatidylglycerophosphate/cardiolipin synthase [Halovivax ruber XH-70]